MLHRIAILTAGLALAAPASAAAADMEGVWTFDGGQIAVKAQPDGSLRGYTIRETRFAECPHEVGELTWENVRQQPDGSYWGLHQWFDTRTCTHIDRGNTAFRVLTNPNNARFLRVCFSPPDRPESQPKIAPDGTSTDVLRRCYDSDLISQLSTEPPTLRTIAKLPRKKRSCAHPHRLRLRLRQPQADALNDVSISVNGRRVEQLDAENAPGRVTLTHVPRRSFELGVSATTVLGEVISGQRTYRSCKRRG